MESEKYMTWERIIKSSAFPSHRAGGETVCIGLTKREYFAAAALTGILASGKLGALSEIADGFRGGANEAKVAFIIADKMIAQGAKA